MDASQLKKISIFADASEEDLKVVSTFATLEEAEAGSTVVKEGDFANHFLAIEEGEARVLRGDEQIGTLGTGDIFGEVGVIEKESRTATVEAVTRLRLIKIEHWELQRMKKVAPELYARIERLAEQRRGGGDDAA
ncbi:MAG TPA: cyclic nucleotide-binding domain-containing protein [Solirubrobacterales bacterium]|nr:cyclic nucleotide-binding domain-containing protein [Solirubrobacterales bacterium]